MEWLEEHYEFPVDASHKTKSSFLLSEFLNDQLCGSGTTRMTAASLKKAMESAGFKSRKTNGCMMSEGLRRKCNIM